jgi:hypothetical protein
VTNVANILPFSGYPMMLLSVMSLLLPMFSLPLASAVADLPAVAVVGVLLLLALLLMLLTVMLLLSALLLPMFSLRDCWFSSTVRSTVR